jgi:sigma-B regulation protein RsbU (phosphoserine phosphatase)
MNILVSLPPLSTFQISVLLIDDQSIIAQAVHHMLSDQTDIAFHYCNDPTKAIAIAEEIRPTIILQDLVMPEMDGLQLVSYFRANSTTKNIPLIVLSTKEDPKIKAEAFALGANDYMVKLPDKVELIARIRYHSNAYIRLLERNEAYKKLEESQRKLNQELQEAAAYVRTLLPLPAAKGVYGETISTDWRFIPSTQLGGDAFGYHLLDKNHFCFYLLDVCGHGVGAAVLSISVMNVLRSQTLPHTNFLDPASVLKELNAAFPMEKHNGMFFTIWYGVYNLTKREIVYSSGGHPPAILITGTSDENVKTVELKTPSLVIGGMPDVQFESRSIKLEKYAKLFLFSDGVYEIIKPDGTIYALSEFVQFLQGISATGNNELEKILTHAKELNGSEHFVDDFSIVKFNFDS